MNRVPLDPTSGERARQIAESPGLLHPVVDPTAGERARQIAECPQRTYPIVDPTDPRSTGRRAGA